MSRLVLGVGMTTRATREEISTLFGELLARADVRLEMVDVVATRLRFVDDERLQLGLPIVGVEDSTLLERFPAPDRVGFAARVAEGCALVGAGDHAQLLVEPLRSAYATMALAFRSPRQSDQ